MEQFSIAPRGKGIDLDEGIEAGLIARKDNGNGFYDRFRDRVTFPILDIRGRVVGFGGRVLDDEAKPKYLNSPESIVFRKAAKFTGCTRHGGVPTGRISLWWSRAIWT